MTRDGLIEENQTTGNEESISTRAQNKTAPTFVGARIGCSVTLLAETVGFEPTDGVTHHSISSRGRYDHFDTSPYDSAPEKPAQLS